jgi:hypothetical protein
MPLLSRTILENLGIELSDEDFASLAEHFETTLDERVFNEVVLELTPEQAEQLAAMQQSSDEDILGWLQANVPALSEIVADEVDILLGELAENSEAL